MRWTQRRGAFALLLVILAGCGSAGSSASPAPSQTAPSNQRPPAPPQIGRIVAAIRGVGRLSSPDDYYGLAADASDAWVSDGETGQLSKISVATNSLVHQTKLAVSCGGGEGCGNLALGYGSVWVANPVLGTVTRVDERTGRVLAKIDMGVGSGAQVYDAAGAIWSANYRTDRFERIDPRTNTIVDVLPNNSGAEALAAGDGSFWLCDAGVLKGVVRLNAGLRKQQALAPGPPNSGYVCFNAAPGNRQVWINAVSNSMPCLLGHAATGDTKMTFVRTTGCIERGLAVDSAAVWVVDPRAGVYDFDPRSAQPVGVVRGAGARAIALGAGSLWIAYAKGRLVRVKT